MSRGMTTRKRPWLQGSTGRKARSHSKKGVEVGARSRKRWLYINYVAKKIISRIRGDKRHPLYRELIEASAINHGIKPEILIHEIECRGFYVTDRPLPKKPKSPGTN